LNTIHLQVTGIHDASDVRDFLLFCTTWVDELHAHHAGEESFLFPMPDTFTRVEGNMAESQEQHRAYWVDQDMGDHPIVDKLSNLEFGFHPIEQAEGFNGRGLDYIRGNLFNTQSGRVLPHDIPGQNNDIIDVLEPEVRKAINEEAKIYLFGSMFNTNNGIHNVHMNQGNVKKFKEDDGVYQDGGLLIQYGDHWTGVFLAFASKGINTHDTNGHVISDDPLTWGEFLQAGRGRRNTRGTVL
jgi:uncharacterized protein YukJ